MTSGNAQQAGSVARSSLIMAAGTFVSRILGMVRSPILLTMVLGLNSPIANAFDVANTLPNILFDLVAGGLVNAVLVPAIVKASRNRADGGAAYINKLVTIAVIIIGSLSVILTLAAPFIVKLFASTMATEWYEITVYFAYWCIPQVFFYGLYAVFGQILNARENFGPYMWVPVANNIVAISGLLLLVSLFGTPTAEQTATVALWQGARSTILAVFSTAGIALQALILLIPLHKLGIRLRPDFKWRGVGLKATGQASLWALAKAVGTMIPMAFMTNVTAGATQRALETGISATSVAGTAAYSSAHLLTYVPISLFALSIATAMFTKMATAGAKKDYSALRHQAASTANTISAFNFLCISLFIVLAVPCARIFVPLGAPDEIRIFATMIMLMSPAIISEGVQLVYNRVCYSLSDTRGVFLCTVPSIVFEIVLYFFAGKLDPHITTQAVVIIGVLSGLINGFLLLLYVRRKIGHIEARRLLNSHLRLALAACATAAIGLIVIRIIGVDTLISNMAATVLTLVVGAGVCSALFVLFIRLFKVPEYAQMMELLSSFLRRFRRR